MFGSSKFNKSNQDEEEINQSINQYDVTQQELEQEKTKAPSVEKPSTRPLRPNLNRNDSEKITENTANTVKRPNISGGRPSINRNSSYNKDNKPENSAKDEFDSIPSNNSVSADDFIKEEDVADKKSSPRPVLNRQNRRENGSYKHTYSSKNEYFNEDNKMAANGLPLRLDKLIDVVSDHQGLDVKKIKEIKKKALLNPESLMKEYEAIFRAEIKPNMDNRYRNLEDAQKKHPDKIVFMFIKDGKQAFKALSKDKANGYEAYDGLILETVSSSRTPFGPANVIFAKDEPELVINADEAFEDDNVSPAQDVDKSEGSSFDDDADLNAKPPANAFKV